MHDDLQGRAAAVRTLQRLGYTYRGGVEWAPPIGPMPDFGLLKARNVEVARLRKLFNGQARLIRRIYTETFREDADLMTVREMIDPTPEAKEPAP